MVVVPVRYDNVGDVWFVRICTLRGLAQGRFEHWYVLLAAFSSVNEDIRVLFPNDVGIGSCSNRLVELLEVRGMNDPPCRVNLPGFYNSIKV